MVRGSFTGITSRKGSGKRPLGALQFNVLAIVLLLVVLPFAVAFISNVGDTAGKDYENSFDWSEPGNNAVFVWNNGGSNYSSLYSVGDCAHG